MNGKCHRALRWEAERGSDNSQVTFQFDLASPLSARGQVAERLNAPVLKTGKGASPSWVRIPPCPPAILIYPNVIAQVLSQSAPALPTNFPT